MDKGKTLRKLLLFTCIVFSLITYGQQKNASLSLEDIYTNHTYSQKSFGPVRWMKDNRGYSTLEANKDLGGTDIVRYDAQSGERTVLVSAKQLTPAGQSKPLKIANYNWSEDDSKLLLFTDTKKVWRYNTRGDYWVLNLKTGSLRQLGKINGKQYNDVCEVFSGCNKGRLCE